MQKVIGVTEIEKSFQAVLEDVAARHTSYVLTRDRHPAAALVPYEDYQRLQELSESQILRRFDETRARIRERSAQFTDEEIAADVAAARDELPG